MDEQIGANTSRVTFKNQNFLLPQTVLETLEWTNGCPPWTNGCPPWTTVCPPWTNGCPTSNPFSEIFGVVNIPKIQSWFLKKGPVEIFPKKLFLRIFLMICQKNHLRLDNRLSTLDKRLSNLKSEFVHPGQPVVQPQTSQVGQPFVHPGQPYVHPGQPFVHPDKSLKICLKIIFLEKFQQDLFLKTTLEFREC